MKCAALWSVWKFPQGRVPHVTEFNCEIQLRNIKLTVNQNQHVRTPDSLLGSDETVSRMGEGPDARTSACAAPVFPRLVKAESEEGNLWLCGRRRIRFESASANVGAEGWAAPAEHIWNNPPAPPGECFHSGHAATLQLTLVKTAYKQDHASSSLLVQEANGGCRYRCHSAWKNAVRSASIMETPPPPFFNKPCMQHTFQTPLPSLCVYCSLYYCNLKLNAQLQHSPSSINLAGSHASIINVCIAAEDSCIAPSRRITAPALSFLKRR